MISKYTKVFGKETFDAFIFSSLYRDRFKLSPFNFIVKLYICNKIYKHFFEDEKVHLLISIRNNKPKKIKQRTSYKELKKCGLLNDNLQKETVLDDDTTSEKFYRTTYLQKNISFIKKWKAIYLSLKIDQGGPDAKYIFFDDNFTYAICIYDDRGLDVLRTDIKY